MEGPLNQEINPQVQSGRQRGLLIFGQADQTENLYYYVRNKRAFSSTRFTIF